MSYEERQRKFGARPGDIVRIFRMAESGEDGWSTIWCSEMDRYVGQCGIVQDTTQERYNEESWGFFLKFADGMRFYVPYTCLEIIK